MSHLVGRDGEEANTRWRLLLESGCRTGLEFAKARECCQYLRQELTGSLSISDEGIGEGAADGSTRATISKEREEPRAAVLKKALADNADPTARPVWSWKLRDKLSSAFLLNTPGAYQLQSSVRRLQLCSVCPALSVGTE